MSKSEYERIQIYLDPNDEYQLECQTLLYKCGRKKSRFLGILAHEFIQASNLDLEHCTKDELQAFIRDYQEISYRITGNTPFPLAYYEKKMAGGILFDNNATLVQNNNDEKRKEDNNNKIAEQETSDDVNKEDIQEMNNALSLFSG